MPNRKLSRRSFFRTAAQTSVALPAATLVGPALAAPGGEAAQSSKGFDFTKQSAALGADKIVDSACQFCNSLCRLKVHLKDGRIIEVRGETDDPVQAGGLCVKGETMMTQ